MGVLLLTVDQRAAFEASRPGGGVCTVLGVSPDLDKFIPIHPSDLLRGKELRGCLVGGYRFRYDLPALVSKTRVSLPVDTYEEKMKFNCPLCYSGGRDHRRGFQL